MTTVRPFDIVRAMAGMETSWNLSASVSFATRSRKLDEPKHEAFSYGLVERDSLAPVAAYAFTNLERPAVHCLRDAAHDGPGRGRHLFGLSTLSLARMPATFLCLYPGQWHVRLQARLRHPLVEGGGTSQRPPPRTAFVAAHD